LYCILICQVRKLQIQLEDIKTDVASKRKLAAIDGAKKSQAILTKDGEKMKASCRDATICADAIEKISATLDPIEAAMNDAKGAGTGSEQERAALDRAYASQKQATASLTVLEEQMIPAGYITPVPEEYSDMAQLQGRAVVDMVVRKPDGQPFDVEGVNFKEAKMKMVIDGYSSPITGGNFIDLVLKGFYNKMPISRSDGFVVQMGDPEGEADGYIAKGSKSVGNGKHGERLIPLETFLRGDKGPFYETTIEDEGRGGEATVLPFSSYGAMGWAREEYDPNTGSSQFFWLLFDSDLTPAGKNVLDGRYPWYVHQYCSRILFRLIGGVASYCIVLHCIPLYCMVLYCTVPLLF
jgi:peptidylprolyl isomerase